MTLKLGQALPVPTGFWGRSGARCHVRHAYIEKQADRPRSPKLLTDVSLSVKVYKLRAAFKYQWAKFAQI
jgi:hypothetical protein